jgi:hypothetical protein
MEDDRLSAIITNPVKEAIQRSGVREWLGGAFL